jgi:hypothetical protein
MLGLFHRHVSVAIALVAMVADLAAISVRWNLLARLPWRESLGQHDGRYRPMLVGAKSRLECTGARRS